MGTAVQSTLCESCDSPIRVCHDAKVTHPLQLKCRSIPTGERRVRRSPIFLGVQRTPSLSQTLSGPPLRSRALEAVPGFSEILVPRDFE